MDQESALRLVSSLETSPDQFTGLFCHGNRHRVQKGESSPREMAVGQNQWYHFGIGAPPILVDFSGDWDVHWGVRGFDPWPYDETL